MPKGTLHIWIRSEGWDGTWWHESVSVSIKRYYSFIFLYTNSVQSKLMAVGQLTCSGQQEPELTIISALYTTVIRTKPLIFMNLRQRLKVAVSPEVECCKLTPSAWWNGICIVYAECSEGTLGGVWTPAGLILMITYCKPLKKGLERPIRYCGVCRKMRIQLRWSGKFHSGAICCVTQRRKTTVGQPLQGTFTNLEFTGWIEATLSESQILIFRNLCSLFSPD